MLFLFYCLHMIHNENLHLKNLFYYSNTRISISETNEPRLREWGVKLLVKGVIALKDEF